MDITLSVVIVEYKSIQEIQACVASLKKHIGVPYEVIISSNSCYGEEQERTSGRTPTNTSAGSSTRATAASPTQ